MESKEESAELAIDYDTSIEKTSDTSRLVPLENLNFDLLGSSGVSVSGGKESEWRGELESSVSVLFEFSDGSLSPAEVFIPFLKIS